MNAVDRIYQEAKSLPEDQRLTLAHRILTAGESDPTAEIESAWDLEIRERIRRYDSGETKARDASQVFEDLDRRLGK
ncbi:MAG: addiction module protein [Candidatus Omnitrophica bacterium]|nr:addiction module protein [Candidatus Omnitrophota bacterium]MCA9425282.1 addiction module protein [Candidatus Omnitrophota bacterium]MCA9437119.1 addiction module protein [Candidatus Omnitrophota bacterium]MCB9770128.1 addiction module protein [Candidatus Omnitrophota bacterium]